MPNPAVVTVMNEFRRDLLNREQQQTVTMVRRWRQVETALIDQAELFARRIADEKLSPAKLRDAQYMVERSQSLLRQARIEHAKYINYANPLIARGQRQAGALGIQSAGQAIQALGVTVGFDRLPIAAIELMVGLAGDGSPLTTLLENSFGAGVDGMFTELIRSTALGKNPRETAERMVREGFSQSLNHMLTIARTEQLRVFRTASLNSYQASGVVSAYRRLATRSARTCAGCLAADGWEYDLNVSFKSHPSCRCTLIPVLSGFAPTEWKRGPQWFAEQSDATQRKILGPGRHDLYKSGVPFDQFATVRRNDTWGDSIQPTPLGELSNAN